MNRFVVPVAILSTILFVESSNAQPQSEIVSERVSVRDLNLNTSEGRARLDARLEAAARRLCQVSQRQSGIAEWRASRQCFRELMYLARSNARVAIAQAQVQGRGTQLAAR